jgi:hypothetical protein
VVVVVAVDALHDYFGWDCWVRHQNLIVDTNCNAHHVGVPNGLPFVVVHEVVAVVVVVVAAVVASPWEWVVISDSVVFVVVAAAVVLVGVARTVLVTTVERWFWVHKKRSIPIPHRVLERNVVVLEYQILDE